MVSSLLLEMLRLYPNDEQRFGGKLEGGSKILLRWDEFTTVIGEVVIT